MAQLRQRLNTIAPTNDFEKSLEVELQNYVKDLANLLNGGVKFSDNFNANLITVSDTGVADTTFVVTHNLKRVPIGYMPFYLNKAGVVYDAGTPWTASAIYLKCNVASTLVKLLIF